MNEICAELHAGPGVYIMATLKNLFSPLEIFWNSSFSFLVLLVRLVIMAYIKQENQISSVSLFLYSFFLSSLFSFFSFPPLLPLNSSLFFNICQKFSSQGVGGVTSKIYPWLYDCDFSNTQSFILQTFIFKHSLFTYKYPFLKMKVCKIN